MAASLTFDTLFDPAFLAALEPFSLRIARAQKGGRLAEQTTSARGQGTDFADFKPYVAGDDLRAIDWNIYRRLGKVFVRVFEEKQDLPVYFLVDVSASMFVEEPPRIHAALRATLALAAVALNQNDSIGLFPFSDAMTVQLKSVSGKANVVRVARALADYDAMGRTDLALAVEHLIGMKLRRGLVVVVSDFFDDAGMDAVVRSLTLSPHQLLMVQVAKAHDADPSLHPDLHGDVLIENGETAGGAELTITPQLIERYKAAYRAFEDRLTAFAKSRGAGLVRIDADEPVLDQLTTLFGANGAMS